MKRGAQFIVAGAIALLVSLGWFFRWQTVYAGPQSAYLMNRWTGEIRWLVGEDWRKVNETVPTGPWGTNDPIAK